MPKTLHIYTYRYHPLDNRYVFSISLGNTKNHIACLEWHTATICLHFHYRLIDNVLVGDYLYLKNGSFNFELDPYQFNLRLHHFSQFLFNVKKKKDFQKLASLWLVGKVVNHVGIYGSKAAEVFRRSNVCLVLAVQSSSIDGFVCLSVCCLSVCLCLSVCVSVSVSVFDAFYTPNESLSYYGMARVVRPSFRPLTYDSLPE